MSSNRTIKTLDGVFDVPDIEDPDLDAAYFDMVRGVPGAKERIAEIEARLVAEQQAVAASKDAADRAARHARRLSDAQTASENAETQKRRQETLTALEPLWRDLDGLATAFAQKANQIMVLSMSGLNRNAAEACLEAIRKAYFTRAENEPIRRRLLADIRWPSPATRMALTAPPASFTDEPDHDFSPEAIAAAAAMRPVQSNEE